MPQTDSAQNALDCVINLEDAGGTLRNISGSTSTISQDLAHTLGEFFTGMSKYPGRIDGRRDATFSLEVVYSQGSDEGFMILRDWWFADPPGARDIEIYIPDTSAGSDLYYGRIRIGNLTIPSDYSESDPIPVTAELAVDHDWHHTTTT